MDAVAEAVVAAGYLPGGQTSVLARVHEGRAALAMLGIDGPAASTRAASPAAAATVDAAAAASRPAAADAAAAADTAAAADAAAAADTAAAAALPAAAPALPAPTPAAAGGAGAPAPLPASAPLPAAAYSHARAVAVASLAEACSRFGDMAAVLAELVRRRSAEGSVVTHAERGMLSLAFKSQLSSARGTLKMLGIVAENEHAETHLHAVQAYARVMEAQVLALATQLLALAADHQLPVVEDELARAAAAAAAAGAPPDAARHRDDVLEAVVFWHKVAADYCRYVSECHTDATIVAHHSDSALRYYSKARQYALQHLHPASPTLLGVTLNFTVFLFEIRRCEEEAYEIAKGALDDAAAALRDGAAAGGAAAAAAAPAPAPAPGGAAAAPTYLPLSPTAREESDTVAALIRENLRVWSQVLRVSSLIV